MTQTELAGYLGVHYTTLNRYLHRRNKPNLSDKLTKFIKSRGGDVDVTSGREKTN